MTIFHVAHDTLIIYANAEIKADCPSPCINRVFGPYGVYGIGRKGARVPLYSVEISIGAEKAIGDLGADYPTRGHAVPGMRFSLAPDGRSFVVLDSQSELQSRAPRTL